MSTYDDFAKLEKWGWGDAALVAGYADGFAEAVEEAVPALAQDAGPGLAALDLCCGPGTVTAALLSAGAEVTGVDFSAPMLEKARAIAEGATLVEADAQDLPFEAGRFDVVTCGFGLMHVPDQPRALAEVARVLKPGGRFAMSFWAGPEASPAFRILYDAMAQHGAPDVALPDAPEFHRFAEEETAREVFGEAGLTVEGAEEVPAGWKLGTPEAFADVFEQGAPRAGYLFRQQPPDRREAVRAAMTAAVREAHGFKEIWFVPAPIAVIRGRKG